MPTSHPMIGEPDPECLLTCPYNPSHRIARKRLQFHLTKCRKNYPNAKKEICPFNTTHMINEQEIKFHLEICPNRGIVDNFKHVTTDESHVVELPPRPVLPPSEENWDNDFCGTYEPTLKLAEAPIIHTLIGATPSERKKCRVQQRQKFRALDETLSTIEPKQEVTYPPPRKEKLIDAKPLRQPSTHATSLSDMSAACLSTNNLCASGTVGTMGSSKIHGKSIVVEPPNTVSGDPWEFNQPGSSQQSNDGFIEVRSKSRGISRR